MKTTRSLAVLLTSLTLASSTLAQPVRVDVFDTIAGQLAGGAPYSDLIGTFYTSQIDFATSTGYEWLPLGVPNDTEFGALISGCLFVPNDGNYSFTLDSDDGSLLYIDNVLVVDNGGAHSPQVVTDDTFLTAGLHPFSVEFFECCAGEGGVDLTLPPGVEYVVWSGPVIPEPGTWLVGIAAVAAGASVAVRRRWVVQPESVSDARSPV